MSMLSIVTVVLWKTSAAAYAVSQLAFGDGAADLVGRKWGKGTEWPFAWANGKTIVGSLAFVSAAATGNLALLAWFHVSGYLLGGPLDMSAVLPEVLAVSFVCAVVELSSSLFRIDDNVSIPIVAAILASLFSVGVHI